jgi:multidrug efflux pump subunit AcrA (membrane-fusion protein)
MTMRVRNRRSVLISGEEGRAPRPLGVRVAKWTFIAAVVAVFGYVAYWVQDRARHFRTPGLVVAAVTPVAPSRDGRVAELPFATGDAVSKGDLVLVVEPGLACAEPDTIRIVNLQLDADLARARRSVVDAQIATRERRMRELAERAGLEVDGGYRTERNQLQTELEDLRGDGYVLDTEIRGLERAIGEFSREIVSEDTRCYPDRVYAPFDGTVYEVHAAAFSVVRAGDPVISLKADAPDVRVLARVEPELVPSIFKDKSLRVVFPDGTRSLGRVDTVYAAPTAIAPLELAEYRLLDGEVVMEIVPDAAEQDAPFWRTQDRLLVQVSGTKKRCMPLVRWCLGAGVDR